jgi:hypothetical protein
VLKAASAGDRLDRTVARREPLREPDEPQQEPTEHEDDRGLEADRNDPD